MLIETLSVPLFKAFAQANKTGSSFVAPAPQSVSPSGDGVWPAGLEGQCSPNRIFVLPYAHASAGQAFSMRVYGWRSIDSIPGAPPANMVQIPFLLIELSCTVGAIPGPTSAGTQIADSERFCDALSLTGGALGKDGEIVSSGAGTGLTAYCLADLRGCRRFSFDFKTSGGFSMNALWARA